VDFFAAELGGGGGGGGGGEVGGDMAGAVGEECALEHLAYSEHCAG